MFNVIGYQRPRDIGLLSATLALYAVGAFLGWQAVVVIALAAIAWTLLSHPSTLRKSVGRLRPTAIVFFGAMLWSACERPISAWIQSR